MKKITKNNVAMVLQVFAVVILFVYPGCSSQDQSNKKAKTELNVIRNEEKAQVAN